MFAGRKVNFGVFPRLTYCFRLDPAARGFLRLPPLNPPDIFVAAAGPQTLKIAGELGDGLILSNLSFPTALIRQGALADAMNKLSAARAMKKGGLLKCSTFMCRSRETAMRRGDTAAA